MTSAEPRVAAVFHDALAAMAEESARAGKVVVRTAFMRMMSAAWAELFYGIDAAHPDFARLKRLFRVIDARKARWSSEHHGKSLELVWSDGRSFETVEKKVRDPWEEMAVAFTRANGWRTVKEAARLIAISEGDAEKVLAELVRRGEFEYEQGPPGRHGSAHCY